MLAQEHFTLGLVRLKSSEDWSFQRDGICVLLLQGGAGKYLTASGSQNLVAGDVLVVNQASGGRLLTADGSELFFSCFSLRLDHLYPLFAGGEISLLEAVTESFSTPKLYAAARPLARQCHRLLEDAPPEFNLDHRSQLLRVASVILTEEFKLAHELRATSLGVEAHLVKVFDEITAEELLANSVGDLAAKFSCSRRHLNRLFHQYFGYSVSALRMEMRLLKAVSILRDGNTKVIHVAAQCGFNHLGLFNTCFKRRFGVSPGEWRRQAAQGRRQPQGLNAEHASCPLQSKGICPFTGGVEDQQALSPVASFLPSGGRKESTYPVSGANVRPKAMAAASQNGGGRSSNGH